MNKMKRVEIEFENVKNMYLQRNKINKEIQPNISHITPYMNKAKKTL